MIFKDKQRLLSKYKLSNTSTKSEDIVESILKELNIKYIRQKGFIAKCHTCFIADFYLPKPHKIIIEVDGEYHRDRADRDIGRDTFFKYSRGINTLRIDNSELVNLNSVKRKIQTYLFSSK